MISKLHFFVSLHQSHDASENILIFWFPDKKTCIIDENSWVERQESSEEQYLSEIEILCNIINIYHHFWSI